MNRGLHIVLVNQYRLSNMQFAFLSQLVPLCLVTLEGHKGRQWRIYYLSFVQCKLRTVVHYWIQSHDLPRFTRKAKMPLYLEKAFYSLTQKRQFKNGEGNEIIMDDHYLFSSFLCFVSKLIWYRASFNLLTRAKTFCYVENRGLAVPRTL